MNIPDQKARELAILRVDTLKEKIKHLPEFTNNSTMINDYIISHLYDTWNQLFPMYSKRYKVRFANR